MVDMAQGGSRIAEAEIELCLLWFLEAYFWTLWERFQFQLEEIYDIGISRDLDRLRRRLDCIMLLMIA